MKKTLLSLLLFLAISTLLCGCKKDKDGSIYGIVTTTGEPLKGIGVGLYKDGALMLNTITYEDGHYEFVNLHHGQYVLVCMGDFYAESRTNVVIESGRQARMDIRMSANDNSIIILPNDALMVQKFDISSGCTWDEANQKCQDSRVGGYSDWRLPNKSELWCVLVKHNTVDNIAAAYYWSSTNGMQGCHYACRIFNFNTNGGNEINQSDNNECRVRAVRNLYGEDKE